ncbi:hypothetical protein [Nonomuraea sp. GTA35]|uniref:hypothetical protein n=1 Tax=Nonomuraea sp. GTA35 TaxID=1676746 RepID=UPI0035BF4EDB
MAEDLRHRYAEELDFACASFVVDDLNIRSRDAIDRLKARILKVRDEELERLRRDLESATATLTELAPTSADGWRERAEQAERRNAHARALHSPNASNPLGPWCDTCMTVWPCATYAALDDQEAASLPPEATVAEEET